MAQQNRIADGLLGKHVHVEVDRPLGYQHGDILYPLNYGYVPDVIAEDGEAQDAYILGITDPVSSFDGQVVGIVRRHNDCEDKLIVAPDGMVFHQGEIAEAVHFQEKFFVTTIDSLLRKSCGIIPFRRIRGKTEYLVLLQENNRWSFPKGHMEAGETELQTALRELKEETGLTAVSVCKEKAVCVYAVSPLTRKQVVLFPGEVHGEIATPKQEITAHRWVSAGELQQLLSPDTYEACAKLLR